MENVVIKDPEKLKKKIEQFTANPKFHIVADFDKTISTAFFDGKKVHSSYTLIREGKYLEPEFTKREYEMFEYYYPIEQSNDVSQEEKSQKMVEWWEKHYRKAA